MSSPEQYNEQAAARYDAFGDTSFSWRYIERPALDECVGCYYGTGARILDLGCGTGRLIRHFIEHGADPDNVAGIDPSAAMIARARANAPGARLVQARAERLPFEGRNFDLVTANMMLHNVDDVQLDDILEEVERVLAPAGTFFFIEANPAAYEADPPLHQWVDRASPWGDDLQVFNHDLTEVCVRRAPERGLAPVQWGELPVRSEGAAADAEAYARYTAAAYRVAGLFSKMGL